MIIVFNCYTHFKNNN